MSRVKPPKFGRNFDGRPRHIEAAFRQFVADVRAVAFPVDIHAF
jgi:ketopantoate hydroxymethyltransferase